VLLSNSCQGICLLRGLGTGTAAVVAGSGLSCPGLAGPGLTGLSFVPGTIHLRRWLWDDKTPEYTVTCRRGGGMIAAIRESSAFGASPMLRVPSCQGRLNSTVTLSSSSKCKRSLAKGGHPIAIPPKRI